MLRCRLLAYGTPAVLKFKFRIGAWLNGEGKTLSCSTAEGPMHPPEDLKKEKGS
jgi:hypothetical protein